MHSNLCSKTFHNNNLAKYNIQNAENSSFNTDFTGLALGIPGKRGAVNLEIAKPGAVRLQLVVLQLVPTFKEAVPPPPFPEVIFPVRGGAGYWGYLVV